jgi:uncharacterized protein (TIGR00299 family) protein
MPTDTKVLYLDLISGISGDMFIGALLDLGVDAARLERELEKLQLPGYHLHVSRANKSGIDGVKFDVHLSTEHEHAHSHSHGHDHDHPHEHSQEHHHHAHHSTASAHPPSREHAIPHQHTRTFSDIRELITQSPLSAWVKEKAVAVFHRLAVAEGKIHGLPPEQVHFHEVGAVDSIVDIVGAAIGLELLGKPRVLASRVEEGTGWIDCAHGRFPIPAPATLAILGARGVPLSQCAEPHELVTPTGAALLAELVEEFGPMRDLVASNIGFGVGSRTNQTRPNVLRAVLGETSGPAPIHDWETDTIAVLETNLDDVTAEVLGHFVERALRAGALDVFYTPVQMKKSRPAILLTVLCLQGDLEKFCELILLETSSFGVRTHLAERKKLRREIVSVRTAFGEVAVKIGRLDGKLVQAAPEFEACKKLAGEKNVPLKAVYEAALRALS